MKKIHIVMNAEVLKSFDLDLDPNDRCAYHVGDIQVVLPRGLPALAVTDLIDAYKGLNKSDAKVDVSGSCPYLELHLRHVEEFLDIYSPDPKGMSYASQPPKDVESMSFEELAAAYLEMFEG